MNIYVTSDWHLLQCELGRKPMISPHYEEILNELDKLEEDDILIHLGDIMDDTVGYVYGQRSIIKDVAKKIRKVKHSILIRGNNDILSSDQFRLTFGFGEVAFAASIGNIILSHTSIDLRDICDSNVPDYYNLHGHIHRNNCDPDTIGYYHESDHNVNLCTKDGRQFRLTKFTDIDFAAESMRNNFWCDGHEKPGMSCLCQNEAISYYQKLRAKNRRKENINEQKEIITNNGNIYTIL